MWLSRGLVLLALVQTGFGLQNWNIRRESVLLQDIVTYDEHSLLVHGQRIFIFGGEFHPFRLPVPDLWLDIFQKIKAMGYNTVSFYVDWALIEGEPGVYRADGIFALEPFFEAATTAGVYLIARPGPYINAEASGGGYPGWLQRVPGLLRTKATTYVEATALYVKTVGEAIAKAQITNGGPVILFQPENEYYNANLNAGTCDNYTSYDRPYNDCDADYMQGLLDMYRAAGIVLPFIDNDSSAPPKGGIFAPEWRIDNSSKGDVDIWGHDSYPLGFDCSNPTVWPDGYLYTIGYERQQILSPSRFEAITEFQGGTFDQWGGTGYKKCIQMYNEEFERVFMKNNFASAPGLINVYMTFGGTSWGNMAWSQAYSSYDYASAIAEDRTLTREKYSELKLEANFLRVTPAYSNSSVHNLTTELYTNNAAVAVTPLIGNGTSTNLHIMRHSNYSETSSLTYKFIANTTKGYFTVPQLGGNLTLSGRDSKWHVTNYQFGSHNLIYSTAEIFTWKEYESMTVLIVYGGPRETHEIAISTHLTSNQLEGPKIGTASGNGSLILNWETSTTRRVIQVGDIFVYILDRNSAYNLWVVDFESPGLWGNYSANVGNTTSVIIDAGYLIRNAVVNRGGLHIEGDLNSTVPLNIIGAPESAQSLFFNGAELAYSSNPVTNEWSTILEYETPGIEIPDLDTLGWKFIDNLPELQPDYDDSLWTPADHTITNNTRRPLLTPTCLFASDYGYNSGGVLIYRGGMAYGSSVWLNSTYLGSTVDSPSYTQLNNTYNFTTSPGKSYVFTILVVNMGFEENPDPGADQMKEPRGILDYEFPGRNKDAITWKLTGNFGGEQYPDKDRGPMNEGGLFVERQGFTQPFPPSEDWEVSAPTIGIGEAGAGFWTAGFELNLPYGYDIPLSFDIEPSVTNGTLDVFRAWIWVNGYQYGRNFELPWDELDFGRDMGTAGKRGETCELHAHSWSSSSHEPEDPRNGAYAKLYTSVRVILRSDNLYTVARDEKEDLR
ncbi:related to beta-galactosidase [Phialocephala subalpina]|uniref:Beta-galactosidase n=1 Tax=Phialocephala subalpina TaxID=576137 RepID=A0A1L7XCX7_9HELO|nr:related to beta-galactosidase [Phialocephala subalpina]